MIREKNAPEESLSENRSLVYPMRKKKEERRKSLRGLNAPWELCNPTATYSFAATAYLCSGKDGYDVLQSCRTIRNAEVCGVLPLHVQNYLEERTSLDAAGIAPKVEGRIVVL